MNRKLKDAMDRSLSGVDFNARLSDGVMRRIEKAEGETDIMKRKMAVSLVAALVLVLILAAGAVAAAYLSGTIYINWFGNPVQWMETAPTPAPTTLHVSENMNDDAREKLLSGKPDNEIWFFQYDDGNGEMHGTIEMIPALDDLKERISEADLPFLVPDPPAGYAFKSAWLTFFIDEQALKSVAFLGAETPYEGVTLSRIRTGEEIKKNIECFNIQFEDANGHQISVTAQFDTTEGEHGFGAREGDIYEPVSVPGMEKALYIKRTGIDEALYLLQTGFEPIQYAALFDFDSVYQWGDNTQIYDAVLYDINSKTVQKDVLLSMANSMK